MSQKKPKIAILSLTCCDGCQVSIMDLGQKFLDFLGAVEVADFPLIEEMPEPPAYDLVFIEGTPITDQDIGRLLKAREKAKILVAIGACACLGGIAEIKNYQDKEEKIRYVYKNIEGINNPEIKPLRELVQVDFEIPGCPIDKDEFYRFACQLVIGRLPKIPQRAVCYECQIKQNECLLQKGQPCLGPIILGGCGAVCPSNGYACDGCRGPIKESNFASLKKVLQEIVGEKEVKLILERFGVKDELLE